jgi:hypothetical protein
MLLLASAEHLVGPVRAEQLAWLLCAEQLVALLCALQDAAGAVDCGP